MNPEIQEWMNNENAKTRSKLNSQDAIDEGLIPYPYNFPAIEFVVEDDSSSCERCDYYPIKSDYNFCPMCQLPVHPR